MRIPLILVALLPLAAQAADEPVAATGEMEESLPRTSSSPPRATGASPPTPRPAFPASTTRRSPPSAPNIRRMCSIAMPASTSSAAAALKASAPFVRRCSPAPAPAARSWSPKTACRYARPASATQRDVRGELRTGAADRSAARAGVVDVWRQRRPRRHQCHHARRRTTLPEFAAGLEGGSDSFKRLTAVGTLGIRVSTDLPSACTASRLALRAGATRRASTRPSSIYWAICRQAAGNCGCAPRAPFSTRKPPASSRATTATRTRTSRAAIRIPKRFATPRARACRRNTKTATRSATGSLLNIAAIYRRSRMDFLQHFLIGKPLEHNAQTSYMVSGTAVFPTAYFLTTARHGRRRAGRLRAHRVPARAGHRRRAAGQCHPPRGLSLRLHRGFQHGGRHARARLPHRPRHHGHRRAARRPD